jgi:hypothetical protein
MKTSTLIGNLLEIALYSEKKDLEFLEVVNWCIVNSLQDIEADDISEYESEYHSLLAKEDFYAA